MDTSALTACFSPQRKDENDKAVYEIELKPEDGLYPPSLYGDSG